MSSYRPPASPFHRSSLWFCAEAAKTATDILTKEITEQKKEVKYAGRVLIGTVAGDIHNIGKSLVIAMLTAAGFEVIDLGVDVPDETFVEKVRESKPDVLGMSALVTSTMWKFGDVIEALSGAGLRGEVKVSWGVHSLIRLRRKSVGRMPSVPTQSTPWPKLRVF